MQNISKVGYSPNLSYFVSQLKYRQSADVRQDALAISVTSSIFTL